VIHTGRTEPAFPGRNEEFQSRRLSLDTQDVTVPPESPRKPISSAIVCPDCIERFPPMHCTAQMHSTQMYRDTTPLRLFGGAARLLIQSTRIRQLESGEAEFFAVFRGHIFPGRLVNPLNTVARFPLYSVAASSAHAVCDAAFRAHSIRFADLGLRCAPPQAFPVCPAGAWLPEGGHPGLLSRIRLHSGCPKRN
jgi:hypothetical protein